MVSFGVQYGWGVRSGRFATSARLCSMRASARVLIPPNLGYAERFETHAKTKAGQWPTLVLVGGIGLEPMTPSV